MIKAVTGIMPMKPDFNKLRFRIVMVESINKLHDINDDIKLNQIQKHMMDGSFLSLDKTLDLLTTSNNKFPKSIEIYIDKPNDIVVLNCSDIFVPLAETFNQDLGYPPFRLTTSAASKTSKQMLLGLTALNLVLLIVAVCMFIYGLNIDEGWVFFPSLIATIWYTIILIGIAVLYDTKSKRGKLIASNSMIVVLILYLLPLLILMS